MFINIITPCTRPENLSKISESINIPKENYRWIVVFDSTLFPNENLIPENCEAYIHVNKDSKFGNSQRNFAINLVDEGYVYFNDDDTTIHPNLWENIKDLDNDFIHFNQSQKDGSIRLISSVVRLRNIDSHNFVVSKNVIGDSRWIVTEYESDGYFAEECYQNSKNKMYINKVLSIYNTLR